MQALEGKFDPSMIEAFYHFNDMKLEDARSCMMQRRTNGILLYKITLGELNIEVIDTPGFGDIRGMQQDEKKRSLLLKTSSTVSAGS